MNKFLEIVYASQIADEEQGGKWREFFEPLMERLKGIVSESVYDELLELLIDCTTDSNRFYAVAGMKLAIGIMDGTYVPKV